MTHLSLGILESTCLTRAIDVADFVLKKVPVQYSLRSYPGMGLVAVAFLGSTSNIREAVESGKAFLMDLGAYHASAQILSPGKDLLLTFGMTGPDSSSDSPGPARPKGAGGMKKRRPRKKPPQPPEKEKIVIPGRTELVEPLEKSEPDSIARNSEVPVKTQSHHAEEKITEPERTELLPADDKAGEPGKDAKPPAVDKAREPEKDAKPPAVDKAGEPEKARDSQAEAKKADEKKKTESSSKEDDSWKRPPHCNYICSLCNELDCPERWK